MNKAEFRKLNYCLELLALKDIISDKKEAKQIFEELVQE